LNKCSDVSEERTASIFKVSGLGQVNTEAIWWKKICYYVRVFLGNLANHIYGKGESEYYLSVTLQKEAVLYSETSEETKYNTSGAGQKDDLY
jgi:hypothetical protein